MAEIRGYSEDDVDLLTDEFQRIVFDAIKRVCTSVANGLQPAVTAASSAGLGPDNVATVTVLWQDEIDGVLTPYIAEVYQGSATSVAVGLVDAFPDAELPGVPLVADEFALTYMKTVHNRLVGVGDELWEEVRNELVDGIQQGASIEQIAGKIQNVANFSENRSRVIARTEVHSAAEAGSISQVKYVGYEDDEVEKEWISTNDLRTRDSHVVANRQRVKLHEKFVVGGAKLDHPGDFLGPADEIIQCRCTTIMHIDEAPKFRCAPALVAAAPPSATQCVCPTPTIDISAYSNAERAQIAKVFKESKVTPAYGGAAIHKAAEQTVAKMGLPDLDVWETLGIMDWAVPKKGAFTYLSKYKAWFDSPTGKKTVGNAPGPHTHAVAPVAKPPTPAQAVNAPVNPSLPPVAPKPSPSQITFTGKTLGSHGAQVWLDPSTGDKWLFKPQAKFLTDLDVAMGRLTSKALLTRPGVYEITLNGKHGSIQHMFNSTAAFDKTSFDVTKLTDADISVLQREMIFDWMISNWDAHTDQFIRVNGAVVGVDKGQAFKFFGKDKLDWDWYPAGNFGTWIYQPMMKAYATGKNIKLNDPTQGALGEFIEHLASIPDAEYRKILLPYASQVKSGKALDDFLDAAVARKNSLKADFADYWKRAELERAKHVTPPPAPKPAPPPPQPTITPTQAAPTIGDPGDISKVDYFAKQDIEEMWIAQGGGKKVTPAWGGAKIFKMLIDLEQGWHSDPGAVPLTHLQLLRILDDVGGFKGKPKTYESVVLDWLASPKSTNTLLKIGLTEPPSSLKPGMKALLTPTPSPPSVKPITPVAQQVADEAEQAFAAGHPLKSTQDMWSDLTKYADDETVAFVKTLNGDTLKLTKLTTSTGGNGVRVYVRKDSLGETTWHHDQNIVFAGDLEPEYNVVSGVHWTTVPSKALTGGKTKIPGKGPGDVVTDQEIEVSKHLWADGDVIAIDDTKPNITYRLVKSPGDEYKLEFKYGGSPTWDIDYYSVSVPKPFSGSFTWKLQGNALRSSKPSVITGKNAGDVISPTEMWVGTGGAKPGDVIAYAINHHHGTEQLRVKFDDINGFVTVESRLGTGHVWKPSAVYQDINTFKFGTQQYTWYASHVDGSMPDQFKSLIPGVKVPGVKTPSNWGVQYAVGDEVTDVDLDSSALSIIFNDYDIIVTKTASLPGGTNVTYRIYKFSDKFIMESDYYGNVGIYSFHSLYDKIPHFGTSKWLAASGKVSSTSGAAKDAIKHLVKTTKKTTKKAAKKIVLPPPLPPPSHIVKKLLTGTDTHIPGKTTNDVLSFSERQLLLDHVEKYVDGTIVATGKSYAGHFRFVAVDVTDSSGKTVTKLVQQKQTSAGTWTSTKFIDNVWAIEGSQWKLTNDKVTPQHLLNMKKAWAKKHAPPKPKSTAATQGVPQKSVPLTVTNFNAKHVDISAWNDSEQEEIFQFFRGKGVYTSSQPQQIWSAVQSVKSHFAAKGGKNLSLTEVEILRIVDIRSAVKHGVTNTHPFEAKITQWMQSPAGKAFINKRIDAPIAAPDVPVPMSAIDPDRSALDHQNYRVVSNTEARAIRAADHAKYGAYTAAQKAALRKYTGGVYTSWNEAIRTGNLGSYKTDIINAMNGMRPSTKPMLLHRGTGFEEFNDPAIFDCNSLKTFKGRTYINRGFNSTSTGGTAGFSSRPVIIEFRAPIGTPMAHVQDFSHHPGENETLLPAHLVYEIVDVTCSGYTTKMTVLVLGPAIP